MKILMVIDTLMCGGAQKMFTFIANGLSEKGFEVTIISYASSQPTFEIHDHVRYIAGTPYSSSRLIRHIRKVPDVRKAITQERPQVVIAFAQIPAIISILASFGKKTSVIFCERGDPFQYMDFISRLKLYPLRFATWSVFQTAEARSYYSRRIRKRSTIIHNPVTVNFIPNTDASLRRMEIVSVGRLDIKQKRQDILIEAFNEVVKVFPQINLVFYGDGDDLDTLKMLVEKLGLTSNIIFAGVVNDVVSKIRDTKIFVLTSDFEGIPNALIEAMAAGVPCISTDCSPGGARLLIQDHVNGILTPRGDSQAIADAIVFLLNNPIIAQQYGDKAQEIIIRFNPEGIIDMWSNVIRTVDNGQRTKKRPL